MKFPRTPHLPGSKATPDDLHTEYSYSGPVIVTEKMDGSNLMLSPSKMISRSGKTPNGVWADPAKNFYYSIAHLIPKGHWLAAEFLYWRKSIGYDGLISPLQAFGAMKGNLCLEWSAVEDLAEKLNIPLVNVIAKSVSAEEGIAAGKEWLDESKEGFVVRPMESFPLPHYGDYVAKFVGPHHSPVDTNRGVNGFLDN